MSIANSIIPKLLHLFSRTHGNITNIRLYDNKGIDLIWNNKCVNNNIVLGDSKQQCKNFSSGNKNEKSNSPMSHLIEVNSSSTLINNRQNEMSHLNINSHSHERNINHNSKNNHDGNGTLTLIAFNRNTQVNVCVRLVLVFSYFW